MNKLVSIIIPVFNEEKYIKSCLISLLDQTYKLFEIIVIDDGSTDNTRNIVKSFKYSFLKFQFYKQTHQGPGRARNYGVSKSKGEILVFVDADMTFDKNFIKDLISPILNNKTIGTFSKNEMNANPNNYWSICWNINRNWPINKLIPDNYPDTSPVYRAILKKEFTKIGGFEVSGQYIDDWSLYRKIGKKASLANGALYYHLNPENLFEVWSQASWIGKNDFLSKGLIRKIKSVLFYSFPISLVIGFYKSIASKQRFFIFFKVIYDLAIFKAVILSFFNKSQFK